MNSSSGNMNNYFALSRNPAGDKHPAFFFFFFHATNPATVNLRQIKRELTYVMAIRLINHTVLSRKEVADTHTQAGSCRLRTTLAAQTDWTVYADPTRRSSTSSRSWLWLNNGCVLPPRHGLLVSYLDMLPLIN